MLINLNIVFTWLSDSTPRYTPEGSKVTRALEGLQQCYSQQSPSGHEPDAHDPMTSKHSASRLYDARSAAAATARTGLRNTAARANPAPKATATRCVNRRSPDEARG